MGNEQAVWMTAIAVNLGAFTLVAWVMRRIFTHTIPRLANSFEKNLQQQQELFRRLLTEQRADFLLAQEQARSDAKEEIERLVNTFKELSK